MLGSRAENPDSSNEKNKTYQGGLPWVKKDGWTCKQSDSILPVFSLRNELLNFIFTGLI